MNNKKNILILVMLSTIIVLIIIYGTCVIKAIPTCREVSIVNESIKQDYTLKKIYDSKQKVAFMTFDDGPSKNTEKILDILERENVKATFFVNGHDTEFARDMYKRIVNEGHAIANHTYSHSYKEVYKSKDSFIKDIDKLDNYIYAVTGVRTQIVRFPGGSNNRVNRKYSGSKDNGFMYSLATILEEKGQIYFDWTVDSTDASKIKQKSSKIISETLRESLKQKYPIILFHDAPAKTTTVDALPEIIKGLKKAGYEIDILEKNLPVNSKFLKAEHGETIK